VLVYSGLLIPNRGLENTIRALHHLANMQLVLLGEGVLRQRLEALVANSGLSDRVTFADLIPHLEVPAFISSADIGIVPYEHVGLNYYLCSPNKLFHYVMAGLPIACSDFPFLRTVVVDNEIGTVFDPSDPRGIAAAIQELISDPAAFRARKARVEALKQRYSWEEQEKRFLGVYESLN
jgi:glycosyltransferase involved in cell wall biosynthesis